MSDKWNILEHPYTDSTVIIRFYFNLLRLIYLHFYGFPSPHKLRKLFVGHDLMLASLLIKKSVIFNIRFRNVSEHAVYLDPP